MELKGLARAQGWFVEKCSDIGNVLQVAQPGLIDLLGFREEWGRLVWSEPGVHLVLFTDMRWDLR